MTDPQPQIRVADLCKTHQTLLVRQCGYGPSDSWQSLIVVTQIALFQGASADSKVHAEIEGDITRIGQLGCLACRKPDLFGQLVDRVQRTYPRSAHFPAIKALGEAWVKAAAR